MANSDRQGRLAATTALGMALFAGSVLFSGAAQAQGGAEALQDDEIVVTATKRGDALAQDVPIAMNAFSGDQLAALNFSDLTSLSYVMPNVQLEDVGTARGVANFTIRGVGINSSIPSVDPTVGVFVDGMYLGMNAGVITDNWDLEAIEVLRGPQGTLYGRNVTGGAVLIRTTDPTDDLSVNLHAGVETGLKYTVDGVISGPIAPGLLSGKFAAFHTQDDGWFENDFDGSDFGGGQETVYRGALRLTPSDSLLVDLRLEQGEANGNGPAGQNHALFDRDSFDFSINERGFGESDWEQAILEVNWDVGFGDGTITSVTGWRDYFALTGADIDSSPNTVFHSRSVTDQDQWSEELRYAGTFGQFGVTTGLYYFEQNLLYIEERFLFGALTRVGGGKGEFSTWGAFTNVDWHLNDQLTVNAGVRYTHEEKDALTSRIRRAADVLDGATVVPGEGVIGGSIDGRFLNYSDSPYSDSWNDISPRVGVQWQPSDDTNLYAYWSQGFRSGGINFRTTTLNPDPDPVTLLPRSGAPSQFDAEEGTTIEIGIKQDFMDRRGRVNFAIYQNEIENMQRETNLPEPIAGVQQVIVNAGEATIWGAELEARFAVLENLVVSAQAGYTNGEYDTVTADLDGNDVLNAADLDQEIPRLAPWTYGLNVVYDLPLFGGILSNRVGWNHRDEAYYNDANTGLLAEADIIDANISFSPGDGHWQIAIYGTNLTDEVTWGGDTVLPDPATGNPIFGRFGGDGPGGVIATPTFSPLNRGKVIGAEIRYQF